MGTDIQTMNTSMRRLAFLLMFAATLAQAAPSVSGGSGGSRGAGPGYLALEPFVVNLKEGSRVRFMQIKMQILVPHAKVQEAITSHMPAFRDRLIMLFAHQDADVLRTPEGREALRVEALAVLRDVVAEVVTFGAEVPGVEAVYFTDFVIQ